MKNLNTQDLTAINGGQRFPDDFIIICFPPTTTGPYNPFPDKFEF